MRVVMKGRDMKVKFWCDSSANINSKKIRVVDLEEEFDISDEEWAEYTEEDKLDLCEQWALDNFQYGVEDF